MDRYVCVHGHFYQPPRENPWLEVVEAQDSARPFHDWNARITAECYGPNTIARILDAEGRICRLVNTYARMSFNVGPTLLAWLEEQDPDVYERIVAADVESRERFGGHGSAMAQVYNHMIMPLASPHDQRTQVRWGIADFRARFGRDPEGMWLAETAVDLATLEVLADHGIVFTVLSPYQAAQTRHDGGVWEDATGGEVDPTRPYRVELPSGRSIAVYFYDGETSRAVAFEGLLDSGERFAQRLLGGFVGRSGPQLVNIATDGESYGHHHRHGEMALAHALEQLEAYEDVRLTNYGEYLELHPPTAEARVVEPSSWSCAHGVDRWRADCGCTTGGEPGWTQSWRAPLREALDWLRDELAPRFEDRGRQLFIDPWAARDDYIRVVLDRSRVAVERFLDDHARGKLDDAETTEALQLLELQRHAMLMYTSCGWFFEELSRLEPVQVLSYAARAIQLSDQLFGETGLRGEFLRRLEKAVSNDPQFGDGRSIFESLVEPNVADLQKVAAHFAITGLDGGSRKVRRIGCYEVTHVDEGLSEAGRSRLGHGRATVTSTITRESGTFDYGVLHFGDHNFACGVRPADDDTYAAMVDELTAAFDTADFPATVRALDEHFGAHGYSLRDLFRDERRRLLASLLSTTVAESEATYRSIYRSRAPLMRFLADLDVELPGPLRGAAEVVVNAELRDAFGDGVDPRRVRSLIAEAERFGVELDQEGLAHALDETIRRTAERITSELADLSLFDTFGPEQHRFFERIDALIDVASTLPFDIDLGRAQHVCFEALHEHGPVLRDRAGSGDDAAVTWLEHFDRLAERLRIAPAA